MKNRILLLLIFVVLLVMGCHKEKETQITSLKMLEGGKAFAVPTGTIADQLVLKRFPDARIKYYNSVLDCVIAVRDKKADVACYDLPILKNIAGKNDGVTVLSELLVGDQYGFAVQLGNKELKIAMDTVLATLKADGTYNDMMKRWFPQKGNPSPMPELKLNGDKGILRFGTAAVTEPMSFYDSNRKLAGFDIEYATRIALYLGKKIEFVDMEFGAMLPALISGKIDMIGAGISITEERSKKVQFSTSYYPSGIAALVRSIPVQADEKSEGILKTIDDIADKRIGVLLGSIHDTYATKRFPNAKILQYQTFADLVVAVNTDKIDAAFFAHVYLPEVMASNPDVGVLVDSLWSVGIGAGFNKEDTKLRDQYNTFLSEIKSNGIYKDMVTRWMDDRVNIMPDIKGSNVNGELKVGTVSDMGVPFAFIKDGKLMGFDVELSSRFAAYLGKSKVSVDMQFGSLLAAVATRKIDLINSSLAITDERKKKIDYSEPYYFSNVCIIANKKNLAKESSSKMKRVEDIAEKKIGVLLGSVHDSYATKNFTNAKISHYQNVPDMLMALNLEKVDAAFYDHIALKEVLAANQDLGVLAKDVFSVDIGAGFNKESTTLKADFNIFLKEIKSNGTYSDMISRWMDKGATDMPEIKNTKSNGILKVGIVSDLGMPFTIIKKGTQVGFDIELSSRFAAFLGKEFVPVDIQFGSMLAALSTKKIDLTTCSLMITEERKKQIDFSDPYFESGISVIAKKKNIAQQPAGKMKSADDLAEKRIGIFAGTVHDAFVANKYPKATVFQYNSSSDMVLSLKTDKIDAAMFDVITARILMKGNPEIDILTDKIFDMPLGIGFNKNNPNLRNEFNTFLKKIRANGVYDEMFKRWFVDDVEKAVIAPFTNPNSSKKLHVSVAVEDLPYVSIMNNEYVGFDIEMIKRFAESQNYHLEITTMAFPALVAALAAGKADMIADGIAISAERSKQIDFSDSYGYFKTAVVVAKKNLTDSKQETVQPAKVSFFKSVSNSFYNNIILEDRYLMIIDGLEVTILIAILSALFGTLIGALICFMRMSQRRILSVTARIYISLIRGTPVLVLLMIIFYIIFASVNISPTLVAVVAFGLNFGAYVSEMFRSSIQSVDKGQYEAGIASGFSEIQTFTYIIMPQAVRQVLPVFKGEFISLLKMTSVVGYIAVQDLTKASDIIRSRTFDAFFPLIMAAVLYIITAGLLTLGLSYLETKVDPKRKRTIKKSEIKL